MGREPNLIRTKQITLSTTPQVASYLGDLVRSGLWGKNASEAAERLVSEQIRKLIQDGTLRRRGRGK
jgi:spore maturation protein CgeB